MDRFLLDTHTFLWWINDAVQLSAKARSTIAEADNEIFLSIASCWEMAIKASLGKLRLTKPVEKFVTEQLTVNSFGLLNIQLHHAAKVEILPFHHRDPFDRLLIAQAITEKLTMISSDSVFADYGVPVIW
ncbi:MAG TPA: type II toxin-antitoxin system VapC family toxin [Smithellaceae bacterium]|nr:type II toxin-antitoxin system VapC family toxin [Smithellaceae bacterium]HQM44666.1 type II toxin-antitoxin system VapC family toxin [Smithellaceae bacterium]